MKIIRIISVLLLLIFLNCSFTTISYFEDKEEIIQNIIDKNWVPVKMELTGLNIDGYDVQNPNTIFPKLSGQKPTITTNDKNDYRNLWLSLEDQLNRNEIDSNYFYRFEKITNDSLFFYCQMFDKNVNQPSYQINSFKINMVNGKCFYKYRTLLNYTFDDQVVFEDPVTSEYIKVKIIDIDKQVLKIEVLYELTMNNVNFKVKTIEKFKNSSDCPDANFQRIKVLKY